MVPFSSGRISSRPAGSGRRPSSGRSRSRSRAADLLGRAVGHGPSSRRRRGSCRSSSHPRAPAPRAGPAHSGRRSASRTGSAPRSTGRTQPGRAAVAAQYPRDRPGRTPSSARSSPARRCAAPSTTAASTSTGVCLGQCAAARTGPAAPLRPRRGSGRPSGARTAVRPRLPWRHGRPPSPITDTVDQQLAAVDGQTGITVGHEDLRVVKT